MAKKPLPQFIDPMMASVIRDPFDNTDWIFETKLDGFRAIALIDSAGKARMVPQSVIAGNKVPDGAGCDRSIEAALDDSGWRNRGARR